MSVARELAQKVLDFSFDDIPGDVIHQTKRAVLDTLGCAIGGYDSRASHILQKTIKEELNGPPEATVFGSGLKTSCLNATLANGAMVRYLDYNDTAFIIKGEIYRTGYHPSEVIPAILALGERQHISGKEAIAVINLGYDLSFAFLKGIRGMGMERRGWNGDTRGAYIMPLIAGRLLKLNADQMENAVGIAASCHAVFGILDAPSEEYTMMKNLRFPMMAYAGILAALLAQRGFTGPTRMMEGQNGFIEVVQGGEYDIDCLLDFRGKFVIRNTCFKSIIADYSSHGHLWATLTLVKEYDIKPEDVREVTITTSKRCAEHTGDSVKKYPKNKETADHSLYYLTAVAIVDRQIGFRQFAPEKYNDPRVLQLIEKIKVVADPSLDKVRPAGVSEIVTKDGRRFRCRVDYPRGHPNNPMTDEELVGKLADMAGQYMSEDEIKRLVDVVFTLEELEDISVLPQLMVFKKVIGEDNR